MNRILLIFLACFSILSLYSQWTWQNPYPQSNHLYGLCFTDTLSGWASGINGSLITTFDGGETWAKQDVPVMNDSYRSIYFIPGTDTGFVAGDSGVVLKTTDGGDE